jgi:DNA-binding FadR family transcriptional regulator
VYELATTPRRSAPERLDRDLTIAILRGQYLPGSRLPTVRELAEECGVNPSTVQRAVARLEQKGLVTARQGSGLLVNDPTEVADLGLLPEWLTATADDPSRAARLLAEFLEIRRVVASRLLAHHRAAVLEALAGLPQALLELGHLPPDEVWRADLRVARLIIVATRNHAALLVLNTVSKALEELPALRRAVYEDPSSNSASLARTVELLHDDPPGLAERLEAEMSALDARSVAAFERLLGGPG